MSEARSASSTDLPESLWHDGSFWGMTATQFLGAFNDNLFKQVVLLMCVDYALAHGTRDYQPHAQFIFALPFILFSGIAGYLSDRVSKRRVVVICKAAEIGIVMLGSWSLSSGSLTAVLAVLFLLGTHSAFFGPSKFGILPELAREKNLPAANGIFLMTTFMGIILGSVLAGFLKGYVGEHFPVVVAAYVGVATTGLLTSLLIRRTPVARPGLKWEWSDLAIGKEVLQMFWRDKPLLAALLMSSLFWLVGGLTQPAVNAFGKGQLYRDLKLNDADASTSLMVGFLVIGIAAGCATAGWISGKKIDFRLVSWGAWGMVVGLALLSLLGWLGASGDGAPPPAISKGVANAGSKILLTAIGMAAGFFTVPIQVFLQMRPPADQKGRVIGAMNLINWIGILLSSQIYNVLDLVRESRGAPHSAIFGWTALLILPVALFYRPRETPRPTSGPSAVTNP